MVIARSRRAAGRGSYLMLAGFALIYLVVSWYWSPPPYVAGIYLIASLISFVLYLIDKRRAGTPRRRVPERTLLLWGLIGGWPGAVVAQQILRHKTVKPSFRRAFRATVFINVALFVILNSVDEWLGPLLNTR